MQYYQSLCEDCEEDNEAEEAQSQPADDNELPDDSDKAVEDNETEDGDTEDNEAEEERNSDSGLEDEGDNKSTSTLSSSVYEGTYFCDRRYHRYSPQCIYPLPDDDPQEETQIIGHLLWYLTLSRDHPINQDLVENAPLSLAPLTNSTQKVLDIATGRGFWAIEYADRHPEAAVIGIDLSPTQDTWVPVNCEFETHNLELDWGCFENFDYIHCRNSFFRKPVQIMRSAYDALKPGGKLETQEFTYQLQCNDNTLNGTYLEKWKDLLDKGIEKLGLGWGHMANPQLMEQQGFENVKLETFCWPTNAWPKERADKKLGKLFNQFLTSDLEGLSMWIFIKALGWTKEEVTVLCAMVRNDLNDRRIHAYTGVYVTCGSKPRR